MKDHFRLDKYLKYLIIKECIGTRSLGFSTKSKIKYERSLWKNMLNGKI